MSTMAVIAFSLSVMADAGGPCTQNFAGGKAPEARPFGAFAKRRAGRLWCGLKSVEPKHSSPMAKSHTGPALLGQHAPVPASPEEAELDRVPNPHRDTNYLARFTAPEFTSLCPVTGQPDFAHLVIDYVPEEWLIESKSLKLYLASFRNHGAYHEDCTVRIGKDIAELLAPRYLRIGGYWYPRGGMPIDVFWQTGKPPEGLWLPDQGVASYRGRG
jgi:7-cyano-7-deazaguanine reductase